MLLNEFDDKMNICVAVDQNFVQHLTVLIISIKRHHPNQKIDLFIIESGLKFTHKSALALSKIGSKISFYYVDAKSLDTQNFKVDGHVSQATYFRLFIAQFIPETVDKLIYLDCDLVVVGSLSDLWSMEIEDSPIAAVNYPNEERISALEIKSHIYFNAGVMLINLKYWREHSMTVIFEKYLLQNRAKIKFWDQDVLNGCLWELLIPAQSKYNYIRDEKPKEAISIIHFVGVHKPWSIHYNWNQRKVLYFRLLTFSSYAVFNLPNIIRAYWFKNRNVLQF